MFGYIKTYTPELKVRENEFYKAAYCGLCRSMGKCTGNCSRLTLSYDMTFLALLRMSVKGTVAEFSRGRCIAHPFRKRTYIKRCEELEFCAYASAFLSYYKCRDNVEDERGKKRFASKLALPTFKRIRRRAKKKLPELEKFISEKLEELSQTEKSGERSVDRPAEIFGDMMGKILSWGIDGDGARIAYDMGKRLGRWLYIIDAVDDLEEDIKRGRYNPIALLYGQEVKNGEKAVIRVSTEPALGRELAGTVPALDLIEWGGRENLRGVVNNIIYVGLPRETRHILFGEKFIDDSFALTDKDND